MKISYGITCCDEHKELLHLINFITPLIDEEDEIVVVYDQNRVTPQVLAILEEYKHLINSFSFDFQQNFLDNKNYLGTKCNGEYIFQIDADEIPHEVLITNLKSILEENDIDMLVIPRKNIVEGITPEHIKKWGWNVNEKGWVNWADQQKRIYKNTPDIQWTGHPVHGMVTGYKTFASLPLEEQFSIEHNKQVKRQESQNMRYSNIEKGIELKSFRKKH
jgi:hypothetical protein